ncbi:hypothetical protein ZIOFF_018598 [Zingiber officinale]|uniref:Uncharacterized protein n=1 Tax=Zingiber officinale TaxID=94328 RepID=A0A8J5HQJ1_ZINOF|nr:hypothetical protein ZIOFF_018598 [Zingiber officinale]
MAGGSGTTTVREKEKDSAGGETHRRSLPAVGLPWPRSDCSSGLTSKSTMKSGKLVSNVGNECRPSSKMTSMEDREKLIPRRFKFEETHKENVICPNKHRSDFEKFYKNRLLYIGGQMP